MQRKIINWHDAALKRRKFGERAADGLRDGMGSWAFVGTFVLFMAAWTIVNSIDDLAWDAVGLLDALGIGRATVVGHSMGSFVARRVALAHPERVARLVLVDSGLPALNPVTREVQAAIQDLPDPVPVAFAVWQGALEERAGLASHTPEWLTLQPRP